MCEVFDLWFEHHRQRVSDPPVRFAAQQAWCWGSMPLCILDGSCHGQLTIEHNGDVYGCDHFVERRWQLVADRSSRAGVRRWTSTGNENTGADDPRRRTTNPNVEHDAGRDIHSG
jgi:uncharacterized protein